ncbi:hypothetical protein BJ912DRAFT_992572 [Pholiota molesta]|nr:hypothetical protein BJ912DRAFT_992572 [Pholiota molesta]
MAAAYGVVEQTAQAAYVRTKSLEKTRFVLQRLREAMVEKEQAIYAAMPELASVSGGEDAEESDEEVPGGLVLRTDLREKEAQRREKRKASKSPTRSSGRPSLSIRPVLDEEDHTLSEYEPPSISHASKFARLMKQGRVNEAVEREKRRISGIFVQPTQDPRQSSPPSAAVSPTPKPHSRGAPMEIDTAEEEPIADDAVNGAVVAPEESDDADDIYVSDDEANREADNESDHQDEVRQGSSPPYPSINALIKRLSGGHHREPEFLATANRHRELALGAEVQNAEELREFEETHSPSMLRLWSVKWAKEMLSGFSRAKETPEDQTDDA